MDDGGPAFPFTFPREGDYIRDMSLRDWFAGEAMQGLLANPHRDYDPKDLAELAYSQAGEMLAARKKERAK